jgi:hypothetical protein
MGCQIDWYQDRKEEIAMLTTDENGMPKAMMPQRWDLAGDYDVHMVPMADGDWVKAEDVQELVAQFNLLAQVASIMVPNGR